MPILQEKREESEVLYLKFISFKLVAYEIYNIIGNPFSSFFGIVFPILMLLIITNAIKGDVPKSMVAQANTTIYRSVAGRKLQLYAPDTILFIHGSHKRNPSSVCEL